MKSIAIYSLKLLVLFFIIQLPNLSFAQKNIVGEWSDVVPFDIVPVAVANLPNGNLIAWSSQSKTNFGGGDGLTYYQIFDPFLGQNGTALASQQTTTSHDMFCPGITNLADGRLLVTGGTSSNKATLYDYKTNSWIKERDMNLPRGYQAGVTLSDGSTFTIGGSWNGGRFNKLGEVWTEETGWRELPGVSGDILYNQNDADLEPEGIYRLDNHSWLWQASNDKIFHAGPGEEMHWINVSGNGTVTAAGKRSNDTYSMKGTTVMFDVDKILKVGGSTSYGSRTPAKDNSYVIDFKNENNVTVTPTANRLHFSRTMHNSVVLPNGEVLVTGGLSIAATFVDAGARLTAEIYNPKTNSWRKVAGMNEPRTYHSVSVLLKDGRVFAGGGGLCGSCATNHKNGEIYSPAYLFNSDGSLAERPTISAPEEAAYNSPLLVSSNNDIKEFAFIRMSSATHSTNNEQRRIPLTFQKNSNSSYSLNVPGSNVLPPGYYMLFALDGNGVPSVSEVIKVGENKTVITEELSIPAGNIAYKRPTEQSSSFRSSPARAVDGITNGDFNQNSVTHTQNDANAWWRVDLGFEYNISKIKIFNRTDAASNRLTNAKVFVGNTPSNNPLDYKEVGVLNASAEQSLNQNLGSGRYVMVRLENTDYLSLAEVQVFGELMNVSDNIALNKETLQSSTYSIAGISGSSSNAVDGNRDGAWAAKSITHTNKNTNAWWRVDFGAIYNVAQIKIFNRTECCPVRLKTGKVYLGMIDSTNPDDYLEIGSLGSDNAFTFNNIDVEGRYVMVKLNELNFLSLAEVEVYGVQKPNARPNIALNKATTQSSTYSGYGAIGSSSNAVDGNRDGNWTSNSVAHTKSNTNAWWRVDLGATYNVDQITVFNRTDCCNERLQTGKVYLGKLASNNSIEYKEIGTLGADNSFTFYNVNADGRYVMVKLQGTNNLSIAEVEVFGELKPTANTNIALHKTTTQSSTYSGEGAIGLSSNAVDGNRDGAWVSKSVTHTGKNANAWWRVDLGAIYNVEKISIFNRTDCCTARLQTGKVYLGKFNSTNPKDYVEIGTLGADHSFTFNGIKAVGRYVMVMLQGTDYLSLAEVEVYGSLALQINRSVLNQTTTISYDKSALADKSLATDEVLVYPNPSNGVFSISLASEKVSGPLRISIYNAYGQELFMKNYHEDYVAIEDINVSHFPSGVYFVVMTSDNGKITKQMIKK